METTQDRYRAGARHISGFYLEKPGRWEGWRGTVMFGSYEAASTTKMYGSEKAARMGARALVGRYQRYLDHSGKRYERAWAENNTARQVARDASKDRRRAFVADRVPIYNALAELCEVVQLAIDSGLFLSVDGKAPDVMALVCGQELVAKHANAIADIRIDPDLKRGGVAGQKIPMMPQELRH